MSAEKDLIEGYLNGSVGWRKLAFALNLDSFDELKTWLAEKGYAPYEHTDAGGAAKVAALAAGFGAAVKKGDAL